MRMKSVVLAVLLAATSLFGQSTQHIHDTGVAQHRDVRLLAPVRLTPTVPGVFTAGYSNLETLTPGIDVNPTNINPGAPPPASFTDESYAGGTTINVSGPAYSAGLSKRAVPLPTNVTIHQITMTYQINPSQNAILYAQVHETDLMFVDAAGDLYNGSCQLNNQEGGMWQIAKAGGAWIDTGFKTGLLPPGVWTTVVVVYQPNWTTLTLSVVSITVGALTFTIPASMQNVAAVQKSGWQPNLLDVQIQDGLNSKGGAFTRDMRNISIAVQ